MKKITIALALLLLSTPLLAQKATDIQKTDPAYSAITRSIKEGYLSVNSGDVFEPQLAITRRELAIVIDKILTENDQLQEGLSRADLQELRNLSKIYKEYFVQYESHLTKIDTRVELVETEQKALNRDFAKLNEDLMNEIRLLKRQNEDQHIVLWVGILVAGLAGVLAK